MAEYPPFINATSNIGKILSNIQTAQTPPKYTQDFQKEILGVKSSSAQPFIGVLKRISFLSADGSPTELYKQFRNKSLAGEAMAQGIKIGYESLFKINEYAYKLSREDLKDLIAQATGLDKSVSTLNGILGTFTELCKFADFNTETKSTQYNNGNSNDESPTEHQTAAQSGTGISKKISLGYTINLNLPETTDIAVFNAIFKSLKDNLLD